MMHKNYDHELWRCRWSQHNGVYKATYNWNGRTSAHDSHSAGSRLTMPYQGKEEPPPFHTHQLRVDSQFPTSLQNPNQVRCLQNVKAWQPPNTWPQFSL